MNSNANSGSSSTNDASFNFGKPTKSSIPVIQEASSSTSEDSIVAVPNCAFLTAATNDLMEETSDSSLTPVVVQDNAKPAENAATTSQQTVETSSQGAERGGESELAKEETSSDVQTPLVSASTSSVVEASSSTVNSAAASTASTAASSTAAVASTTTHDDREVIDVEAECSRKEPTSKEEAFLICGACRVDLRVEYRKTRLLGCLHPVCHACYQQGLSNLEGKLCYRCSVCGFLMIGQATDNFLAPFLLDNSSKAEGSQQACTSCTDRKNVATTLCEDCKDYLCSDCVAAHERVKVTKDHKLNKLSEASAQLFPWLDQKELKCPWHRQEPLLVFCETCQHLTCKDCQLSTHKDHSYQLVRNVAADHRLALQQTFAAVEGTLAKCKKSKELADTRMEQVNSREAEMRLELGHVTTSLTNAVLKRATSLLHQLQALCSNKRMNYADRKDEIDRMQASFQQANFATEAALASNNDAIIVYAKQLIQKHNNSVRPLDLAMLQPVPAMQLDFTMLKTLAEDIANFGQIRVDPSAFAQTHQQSAVNAAAVNSAAVRSTSSASPASSSATASPSSTTIIRESPPPPNAYVQGQFAHGGLPMSVAATTRSLAPQMPLSQVYAQLQTAGPSVSFARQQHVANAFEAAASRQAQLQQRMQVQQQTRQRLQQHSMTQRMNSPTRPSSPQIQIQLLQESARTSSGYAGSSMQQQQQGQETFATRYSLQQQQPQRYATSNQRFQGQHAVNTTTQYRPIMPNTSQAYPPQQQAASVVSSGLCHFVDQHSYATSAPQALAIMRVVQQPAQQQQAMLVVNKNNISSATVCQPPPLRGPGQQQAASQQQGPPQYQQLRVSQGPPPLHCAHPQQQQQQTTTRNAEIRLPIIVSVQSEQRDAHTPQSPAAQSGQQFILPQLLQQNGPQTQSLDQNQLSLSTSSASLDFSAANVSDSSNRLSKPDVVSSSVSPDTCSLSDDLFALIDQYSTEAETQALSDINTRDLLNGANSSNYIQQGSAARGDVAEVSDFSVSRQAVLGAEKGNVQMSQFGLDRAKRPQETNSSISKPPVFVMVKIQPDIDQQSDDDGTPATALMPIPKLVLKKAPLNVSVSQHAAAANVSRSLTSSPSGERNESADEKDAAAVFATQDSNSDTEWDDYCSVCQNGGELLCCEARPATDCRRVFHKTCHVPLVVEEPKDDEKWICAFCTDLDSFMTDVDRKYKSGIRPDPDELTVYERRVCQYILLSLYCHCDSLPFHEPVNPAAGEYYELIDDPIDFSVVRQRLETGGNCKQAYSSIQGFINDLNRLFQNCAIFNSPESDVGIAGRLVADDYRELVDKLLPAYAEFVFTDGIYRPRSSNTRKRKRSGERSGSGGISSSKFGSSGRSKQRRVTCAFNGRIRCVDRDSNSPSPKQESSAADCSQNDVT